MKTKVNVSMAMIASLWLATSCASSSTRGASREVITPIPEVNPTRVRFEIENLPASAFPKLSAEDRALPARERARVELWRYAERVITERGWCPKGTLPFKGSSAEIGAGRYIDRFTIECKQ